MLLTTRRGEACSASGGARRIPVPYRHRGVSVRQRLAVPCGVYAIWLLGSAAAHAQVTQASPSPPPPRAAITISCASKVGERQECAADTSRGVVLMKSYGDSACLLGKTWGYDDKGVWVADGCVADFLVARGDVEAPPPEAAK